jgi:hypothetical protein
MSLKALSSFILKISCVLFLALTVLEIKAQSRSPILSSKAEVSLLTCSPGDEVYSLFGHSAMRVHDPKNDFDIVFNYGTFTFNDEFTYNFVMGKLNYKLGLEPFDNGRYSFVEAYAGRGRGVTEQILNLDSTQKQKLFDFLNFNARPENREYRYDFFYDNCSSRIRDIVENNSGGKVVFIDLKEPENPSFRDIIDRYGIYGPWIDFGIDLGLGMSCDKEISSREYVFLPDYLMDAFDKATINGKPLVKETIELSNAKERSAPFNITDPQPLAWLLFGVVAILSAFEWRKKTLFKAIDVAFLLVFGAVGALVFFLWFFTEHTATNNNLNILWAWPTHWIALGFIWFGKPRRAYFKVYGAVMFITALCFWFLPQGMHPATLPLILLALVRSISNVRFEKLTA